MDAFHIISTAPFFAKNNGAFALEDFDLFTAVISALEWRRDGSRIFLYCDAPAADYIRNAGLEKVWDGVRDTLPDDLDGIDPEMFWAAGKLLALRQMDAPCAMIDTDLIVWSKPEFGRDIIAAHREDLNPDVYPPLEYFSAAGHILPGFSREVLPLNTAFFYVPDNDFKEFYTSQAVAFMKSAERCGERLRYMVFAEQRMAAMCADYTGNGVQTLLDKDALFFPQDKYTHLWGAKQQMRERPLLREEFIWRCIARILRDFDEAKNKQFKNALNGLFPARLAEQIVILSGINPDKEVNAITKEERAHLVSLTKNLPLTILSVRSYNEAIITQGGVKVQEVQPKTMESKLVQGLYFAGELLDIDALTGGYNLQLAWSTGSLVGDSIV